MSSSLNVSECAVDIDDLLARCLGRVEIAERVLKKFRETIPSEFDRLEQAMTCCDLKEVALIAHRIKGAALAVAARQLCDHACSLETSARLSNMDEVAAGFARLNDSFSLLRDLSVQTLTSPRPG